MHETVKGHGITFVWPDDFQVKKIAAIENALINMKSTRARVVSRLDKTDSSRSRRPTYGTWLQPYDDRPDYVIVIEDESIPENMRDSFYDIVGGVQLSAMSARWVEEHEPPDVDALWSGINEFEDFVVSTAYEHDGVSAAFYWPVSIWSILLARMAVRNGWNPDSGAYDLVRFFDEASVKTVLPIMEALSDDRMKPLWIADYWTGVSASAFDGLIDSWNALNTAGVDSEDTVSCFRAIASASCWPGSNEADARIRELRIQRAHDLVLNTTEHETVSSSVLENLLVRTIDDEGRWLV